MIKKSLLIINFYILISIFLIPPILFSFSKKFWNLFNLYKIDRRVELPPYKDKTKAKIILQEFKDLDYKSEYKSFIGWRRKPYSSKYTNIDGKYQTRVSFNEQLNNSVWFFGGSPIWGTGVSDYSTIPSFYAKISGEKVFNFGETGWTSRQSLNQLISLIGDGIKPKKVIFYSGINDFIAGCRSKNKYIVSHGLEAEFSDSLKKNTITFVLKWLFEPYFYLIRKYSEKLYQYNNCLEDGKIAEFISDHYINNLFSAFLLSKNYDADFLFILPPTVYTSTSPSEYLNIDNRTKKINLKIFNLIVKKVKERCFTDKQFCESFQDGSTWLDVKKEVFIDNYHINDEGAYQGLMLV